jgi:hypothetical protein
MTSLKISEKSNEEILRDVLEKEKYILEYFRTSEGNADPVIKSILHECLQAHERNYIRLLRLLQEENELRELTDAIAD